MKRTLRLMLVLALLCALAVPAGAEAFPQEITWTDYARIDDFGDYSDRFYRGVDRQGRMGFVKESGGTPLPCEYEDMGEYLGWVKKDGKWDMMHQSEETWEIELLLPFEYDGAGGRAISLWNGESYPTRIAVQRDGKWGYVDETNTVVIPFLYEAAGDFHAIGGIWNSGPQRAIVKRDGKWGMIDADGKHYWPFAYDALAGVERDGGSQYGDTFMVQQGGKWGLIDLLGQVVIPLEYDSMAADETMDLFAVTQNGKYGFLSKGGDSKYHAYPCVYDQLIHQSYENYAAVERGGKWGAVALGYGGEAPCVLDQRPVFGSGMAPVRQADGWQFLRIAPQTDGTLIWETALPGCYEEAGPFVAGLAPVKQGGKWGLIDEAGGLVLPCEYDSVQPVGTGHGPHVIVAQNGVSWGLNYDMEPITAKAVQSLDPAGPRRGYWKAEIDGKYGLYHEDGQVAAPFVYGYLNYDSWGTANILVERDGRWGFLRDPASAWREKDLSIQWLPQYDSVEIREGGRLAVRQGEKMGLAALDGTLLAPCIYTEIYADDAGGYGVYDGIRWGALDRDGRVVKPVVYRSRALLEQGVAAEYDEASGLWGLRDNGGAQLTPYRYDGEFSFEADRAIVRREGVYGVIDKNGREVIPCVYSYIDRAGAGKFLLLEGDKMGFAREDGEVFLPIQYDLVAYATATMHGGATRISGGVFHDGICAVYLPGAREGEEKLVFINEMGETVGTPDYEAFMALKVYDGTYRGMDGEDPRLAGVVCNDSNYPEPQGDGTALYEDTLGNRLVLQGYQDQRTSEGQGEWVPFPADLRTLGSVQGYTVVEQNNVYGLAKHLDRAQTVSDWARDEVERARELGLVPEREAGYYTYSITRLQFAELMVNLIEDHVPTPPADADRFTDTEDLAARKAAAMGIVTGTGDGSTFSPDAFITREQIAAMLCRAEELCFKERGFTLRTGDLSAYTDADRISDWARPYMEHMTSGGVLEGTGEYTLSPQEYVTVEQAVVLMLREAEAIG